MPRDGVTVFRAALAVVALAVADDAFIHPEPGVAAGDHLASGLVPLALAALLIVVAPPPAATSSAAGSRSSPERSRSSAASRTASATSLVDRVSGDDVTAVLGGARRHRRSSRSASRRCGAPAARPARAPATPPPRRASASAVLALTVLVVLPTGIAIVATHKARSPVAAVDSRPPLPRRSS